MSGTVHRAVVVAACLCLIAAAVAGPGLARPGGGGGGGDVTARAVDAATAAPGTGAAGGADEGTTGTDDGTTTGKNASATGSDETIEATDLAPSVDTEGTDRRSRLFSLAADRGSVEVVVVATNATAVTDARLERLGGRILSRHDRFVQANLTAEQVRAYRGASWVEVVRLPAVAVRTTIGEGPSVTNATDVHDMSIEGEGVRVGVLDGGFDTANPDLNDQVAATNAFGTALSSERVHGTAVAEIVAEMAPKADLYLAAFAGETDYRNAVDWLDAQDVDVIVMSVSWLYEPADGTGGTSQVAADAVANGSVWVNSAGNYADQHWAGSFADTDADTLHEFAGPATGGSAIDEVNQLNGGQDLSAGESVYVMLEWDDWPAPSNDYDLHLYERDATGTWTQVKSSRGTQTGQGYQRPIEVIEYQVPTDGTALGVAIETVNAAGTSPLELYTFRTEHPEYENASGSVLAPAASDATISVGAHRYDGGMEAFSSVGPTDDGRPGVDVSGPDGTYNDAYAAYTSSDRFYGTSAAAPHVGGVAALVVNASDGGLSPAEVEGHLESTAIDVGAPGPDEKSGHGEVDALAAVEAVRAADAAGSTATRLAPTDRVARPTNETTYTLQLDAATGGVGAIDASVTLADPSVATITDVAVLHAPTSDPAGWGVRDGGDRARIDASGMDGPQSGTVDVARVTVRGDAVGSTGVDLAVATLANETGDGYAVTAETNANLTVADPVAVTSAGFNRTSVPEGTAHQRARVNVSRASADGDPDAVSLLFPSQATVAAVDATVTRTDGSAVPASVSRSDRTGGVDNQVDVVVDATGGGVTNLSVTLDLTVAYDVAGADLTAPVGVAAVATGTGTDTASTGNLSIQYVPTAGTTVSASVRDAGGAPVTTLDDGVVVDVVSEDAGRVVASGLTLGSGGNTPAISVEAGHDYDATVRPMGATPGSVDAAATAVTPAAGESRTIDATVQSGLPAVDLNVTSLDVPAAAPANGSATVTATVRNEGADDETGLLLVRLDLFGDGSLDAVDEFGRRTVTLAPGASETVTFDVDFGTASVGTGDRRIGVVTGTGTRATTVNLTANPFPDGVPGVSARPPTDDDGDGIYEDVDGRDGPTFLDVVSLLFADWTAINGDPAQRAALDADGSGRVGFLDVVTLLFEL
jgi:hypothetical protein